MHTEFLWENWKVPTWKTKKEMGWEHY